MTPFILLKTFKQPSRLISKRSLKQALSKRMSVGTLAKRIFVRFSRENGSTDFDKKLCLGWDSETSDTPLLRYRKKLRLRVRVWQRPNCYIDVNGMVHTSSWVLNLGHVFFGEENRVNRFKMAAMLRILRSTSVKRLIIFLNNHTKRSLVLFYLVLYTRTIHSKKLAVKPITVIHF